MTVETNLYGINEREFLFCSLTVAEKATCLNILVIFLSRFSYVAIFSSPEPKAPGQRIG